MAIPQDVSDYFQRGHNAVYGHRNVTLTANGTVTLPKFAVVDQITIYNRTANAVTGGIRVGTAAAGTQVLAATAVGANALVRAKPADLNQGYSKSAVVPLYVEAVTAWNSATVEVRIDYSVIPTY